MSNRKMKLYVALFSTALGFVAATNGNGCPEDIEMVNRIGQTRFPQLPIEILEQSTSTVKFGLRNSFPKTIARIFTQFKDGSPYNMNCVDVEDLEQDDYGEYTAYCMRNRPISIIHIWVSDASLDNALDTAGVPQSCNPHEDDVGPTIQYTFKISCKSHCSSQASVQLEDGKSNKPILLEPNYNTKKRGPFCLQEKYSCDLKPDMVYVCRYSDKGYQTHCVHEAESNLSDSNPKDYCGRCADGVASQPKFLRHSGLKR